MEAFGRKAPAGDREPQIEEAWSLGAGQRLHRR